MTRATFDFAFDVKAAGEAGEIEGIAWAPGPDRVGDVISAEAFAGARPPIPMLDAHDPARAVGVWEVLTWTARGLVVKGRLLIADVARAAELHALVKAGGVRGLSIGFETRKAAPRPGGGRTISALNLLEISLVAIPCHPGARVTAAKAAQSEGPMPDDLPEAAEAETTAETTLTAEAVSAAVAAAVAPLAERLAAVEVKAARPYGANAHTPSDIERKALERKAFINYLAGGVANLGEIERKALTLTAGANGVGSVLAPPELSSEILRERLEFSPFRGLVSVRSTESPSVQTSRRVGRTNAAWRNENVVAGASEPTFNLETIEIKELATFSDASNNLINDSAAGFILAELAMAFGEDFGLKESAAIVSGNGAVAPLGILSAGSAVARVVSGHASQLTADGLITAFYALQASYRNRGTWVMNGGTLAAIRRMKGSDGHYIWQPSLAAGAPETILGRPVAESIDMPDIEAGADPIIFGDFASAYRLVDRAGITILADPFSRATEGITRVHAVARVGGKTVTPNALRVVRVAAS